MSAAAAADRWPLVARTGELAEFAGILADPHRRGVLIFGPAGVGKTRLADEFLSLAAAAGYSCGRAAGSSTASEIPLGALAHLLPATVGRERLDAVALFTSVAARSARGSRTAGSSCWPTTSTCSTRPR